MSSWNLFASILMACLLTVGLGRLAPVANAAPLGQSFLSPGDSAKSNVIKVKRGDSRTKIYLPAGPSYLYHDYPYYYSRGYYPYHTGGYVYYNPKTYDPDHDDAGYKGVPYSAKERCDRRFGSFEWDTGLYTTYGGNKKLCPYLR
jgi:hypothetical protein